MDLHSVAIPGTKSEVLKINQCHFALLELDVYVAKQSERGLQLSMNQITYD